MKVYLVNFAYTEGEQLYCIRVYSSMEKAQNFVEQNKKEERERNEHFVRDCIYEIIETEVL